MVLLFKMWSDPEVLPFLQHSSKNTSFRTFFKKILSKSSLKQRNVNAQTGSDPEVLPILQYYFKNMLFQTLC